MMKVRMSSMNCLAGGTEGSSSRELAKSAQVDDFAQRKRKERPTFVSAYVPGEVPLLGREDPLRTIESIAGQSIKMLGL